MEFFDKLFGKPQGTRSKNHKSKEPEHSVIVRFNYGIDGLDTLHHLEDELEKVITENSAGEYDGHEMAVDYSDGSLYMYGPNAEELFKVVKPILESVDFMKGANVKLRFGPAEDGVHELDVKI